jgi:TMEM175 potassium channel family protein
VAFLPAYVVSFVTVAIVWVNHHALMDGVARADRTLLELNLLLLLFVALVPWPTGLLAEYLREGEQSAPAAVTYGLTMTCMAASFTGIWIYLQRRKDLAQPHARPRIGKALRRSLVGPLVYALATAIALINARAAFALFAAVAAYFSITGRVARLDPSDT